jgi:acyl carrier protein
MDRENEIRSQVIEFLKDEFFYYTDYELSAVNLNTELIEVGFDSLDLLEISMDLENEFCIELYDEDWENWETPEDIISCVVDRKMKDY